MVLITSGRKYPKPHLWGGDGGGGARENRGGCAGVAGAGEKRGREVEVLKRREAGEITQCLIFRNRIRVEAGNAWHGRQEFLTPVHPSPPPPRTMESISNFESAHVLCQIAVWDCFGGRILSQFLAHPCNREVKSLSHIVMVAKFLNLNNSWSCKHGRKRKRKKLTWMTPVQDCTQEQSDSHYFHRATMQMAVSVKKDCWDPGIMLPW